MQQKHLSTWKGRKPKIKFNGNKNAYRTDIWLTLCVCFQCACNYDDGNTENFCTASKLTIDSLIKIGPLSLSLFLSSFLIFVLFSIFDCGFLSNFLFANLWIAKWKEPQVQKKRDSTISNSSTTETQYTQSIAQRRAIDDDDDDDAVVHNCVWVPATVKKRNDDG